MKEILNSKQINWFKKAFEKLSEENITIDFSFVVKKGDVLLVNVIFAYLPIEFENSINNKLTKLLEEYYNKSDCEELDFNLRVFDREVFYNETKRYNPDILNLLTLPLQIITGESIYEIIKTHIDNNKEIDIEYIFTYYWEDFLETIDHSNEIMSSAVIQLNRIMLNGLKMLYVIDKNSKIEIEKISEITNTVTLKDTFNKYDWGVEKEILSKIIFDNNKFNLIEILTHVEIFLQEFQKIVFKLIEKKIGIFSIRTLSNFLIILDHYKDNFFRDEEFKDFSFSFLSSLNVSVKKESDDYNILLKTAKIIGLYEFE